MATGLKRVSPTQIKAFRDCPRLWFFGWVLKIKSPSTESQIRGSDIHQHAEDYAENKIELESIEKAQKEGKFYLASLLAAIKDGHLPRQSKMPGLLIEQHAGTMVFDGDVKANGKIDLTYPWPDDPSEPLVIRDWKSCKSFRYVKSPEQLALDTQAVFYANEMVARGWKGSVVFEHFYLRTNSSEYQRVRTQPMSQEYLREQFLDMERSVVQMKAVAAQQLAEVTKDKTACRNYGGCFHLDPCSRVNVRQSGVGIMSGLNLAGTKGRKASSSPSPKVSPLAARLNSTKEEEPAVPTRYEILTETITLASDVLRGVDWDLCDVEATQDTFQDDVYRLACDAIQSDVKSAISGVAQFLDDLSEEDFATLKDGVGQVVVLETKTVSAVVPQGEVNPPDASPNHHPAPGEEPLSDLGLDGRAAKPLARAGVSTMSDLLGHLSAGTNLTDLDGVGATAANKAIMLAVTHLLSDRGDSVDVAQFAERNSDDRTRAQVEELQAQVEEAKLLPGQLEEAEELLREALQHIETLEAERPTEGSKETSEQTEQQFTLYVGCHVEGAAPVQRVLAECVGDELAGLYSAAYDDGKKSVAASFLANLGEVKSRYPEISFDGMGGGMFSNIIFEVLAPHATRIVRGS